jgi:hypothetical protein
MLRVVRREKGIRIYGAPLWQREIPAAWATKEMILVAPDAFSRHNGSFYSNSKTTGDWETFIAGTGRCGSG